MSALRWLDFDYSEGDDGTGVFDAMASVPREQVPQVEAEIARVLAWAEAAFPGRRGPTEEGGDWDGDLQVVQERDAAGPRHTFSLSLAGSAAFCEAFRVKFDDPDS